MKNVARRVITVGGIRGKSFTVKSLELLARTRGYPTVAKITGDYPIWVRNGEVEPIERPKGIVSLNETLAFKDFCDEDTFVVLENQGIKPETMRYFNNKVARPNVALIVNIELDHTNTMGRTLERIASSTGYGIGRWPELVLSGERNPALNRIIAKRLNKHQQFLPVNETREEEQAPMMDLLGLLDATLQRTGLGGLTCEEDNLLRSRIAESFTIRESSSGLLYFDAAKINDLGSAKKTFTYLHARYPDKTFHFVAYFRKDRQERTEYFIPWFRELVNDEAVRAMHFVGHTNRMAARHVKARVRTWKDSPTSIPFICEHAQNDASVIILACNAVNPFMRAFRAHLAS
ncbi:MAG TPA: hypothetical protein VFE94_04570 [Candidatus Paceibacterota bacterium]|nr:hypothetical protein [Candidatus Paceibacterota bacterium]